MTAGQIIAVAKDLPLFLTHPFIDGQRPASALLGVVLMEFGDFAMMRPVLRAVKERAENQPRATGAVA